MILNMTTHNQFSFFFYITIFFGYFTYNFAVLKGFPDFLGGMFTISVIFAFPLTFFIYLINLKEESNPIEWVYFALLIYVLSYSIIAAIFLNTSISDPPVRAGLLFIFFSMAGWYIGRFLTFDNNIFFKVNILTIAAIIIFFIFTIIIEGNIFAVLFLLLDESGTAGTYQAIGRSIFFIGAFTILYSKNYRFLLFIIFTILLFLTGSRTHILGLISIFLVYTLFAFPKLSIIILSMLLIFIVLALSLISNYFPEAYFSIVNSRASELFNLSSSASVSIRLETFATGLNVISENPIFGKFGHYHFNNEGYPHNILYAWSNWGIIPFILITIIFFSTILQSFVAVLKKRNHKNIFLFAYIISITILFSSAVAPIEDISLGVLVGLFIGITNDKKKDYSYL